MPSDRDKASKKRPLRFALKPLLMLVAVFVVMAWVGQQYATNEFFFEILMSLACFAVLIAAVFYMVLRR